MFKSTMLVKCWQSTYWLTGTCTGCFRSVFIIFIRKEDCHPFLLVIHSILRVGIKTMEVNFVYVEPQILITIVVSSKR